MSRLSRTLVRTVVLVSAGTLLVGLTGMVSGCGAGQVAQTASKQTAIGGVNAEIGDIAIRNAYVVAPTENVWAAGATVPLSVFISNMGAEDDRLMSVSSPQADSVSLLTPTDSPASPAPSSSPPPGTTPNTAPSVTPSPSLQPSGFPRSGATPGVTPVPTKPFQPLDLRHHTVTILSNTDISASAKTGPTAESPDDVQRPGYLMLVMVSKQLRSGDILTVKLTFAKAGSITLKLPVAVPPTSRPRAEPTTDGHE